MADGDQIDHLRLAPNLTFGERLRMRRQANGESQANLGKRFGVTQQTIGTWEKGGRPESKYFKALSDYLDMGNEEKLVALLDAHSASSPSAPGSIIPIDLSGLSDQEVLRKVAGSFLTHKMSGVAMSPAEADVYLALIRKFDNDAGS